MTILVPSGTILLDGPAQGRVLLVRGGHTNVPGPFLYVLSSQHAEAIVEVRPSLFIELYIINLPF